MNNLITQTNPLFGEVRFIKIGEKPYAVANDVAEKLGYSRPRKAVSDHCKGVLKQCLPTQGGVQEMSIIPEGDIYRLIIKSRLPQAEQFEKWVFDEVLPQIRPTWIYTNVRRR
jgi:anti-repressor protein|nr:Bro-N domain-containing protein [Clostridium paraputrificum]